ncbi:MAG: S-layer homology domain-containing protein [Acidobacteriota bacterium]
MFRRRLKTVVFLGLIIALITIVPVSAYGQSDIVVHICDPRHPGTESYEGTTIYSAISVPSVPYGANRELGTLRVTGKNGKNLSLKQGDRIMVVLPIGTSYMRIPDSWNYRKYVEWPTEVDGLSNQLCDTPEQPAVKFISATPRSITIEIVRVDGSRKKAVLDFIFNKNDFSMIRLSQLIERVPYSGAHGNAPISRIEFLTMLSEVTNFFSPRVLTADNQRPPGQSFIDGGSVSAADMGKIEPLLNAGIINGSPDGRLNPGQTMTRLQAIAIIGSLLADSSVEIPFDEKIPAWAEKGIRNAMGAGVIQGYTDGTMRGQKALTRGEALIMLQKLFESYSYTSY